MKRVEYWQSLEQYQSDPELLEQAKDEFPVPIQLGVTRRSFIKLLGFSATALLTSCRAPEQKIITYVNQPVEMIPGVANWYATTCGGCSANCGVLAKVRDGRPIKLEGNPDHPLNRGGLCPVAHAMMFGLYDSSRLKKPRIKYTEASWSEVDHNISAQLTQIAHTGGAVRLLTGPISGPASLRVINSFLSGFADSEHIVYQPVSYAAISLAHQRTHNQPVIPSYRFEQAKLVISFAADFLGSWLSPVQFTKDYSLARNLLNGKNSMSRHIQFESSYSLTGSNADKRYTLSTTEMIAAILLLAERVAEKTGFNLSSQFSLSDYQAFPLTPALRQEIEQLAIDIDQLRGQSLIVCGLNDTDVQYLINFINYAAGNYRRTVDLSKPTNQCAGNDHDMARLITEMQAGKIAALIISGVNPVYDYYAPAEFKLAMSNVPLTISLNPYHDETTAQAEYACPQPHFLEAWNDAEPVQGIYSISQPMIAPLFNTRNYQDSLLHWQGEQRDFYTVLQEHWRQQLFPQQTRHSNFLEFWDNTLQTGVFVTDAKAIVTPAPVFAELAQVVARLIACTQASNNGLNLVLYEKVSLRDGTHANNPWLQELPDPITKTVWDNYAAVSPKFAAEMQLEEGSVVTVLKGERSLNLPIHIQPGQHDSCIAIALGYGKARDSKDSERVGANAYPFVTFHKGTFHYTGEAVKLVKTLERVKLAKTQIHHSLEDREIIKEFTLATFLETQADRHNRSDTDKSEKQLHNSKEGDNPTEPRSEYRWGMAIDLNACTGCSACVLSCQAENNIPVVGKEEVQRQREMHWLRIDRYYNGEPSDPKTVYQPVMCGHCTNASCESVCPVLATVHSSDGLNMQVYNRCVGTRYCENNCAIKTRRFNWFEYPHDDPIANLALNPDVTVRTRGVMEKCSFCVQRIEAAKIRARNEQRNITDGEVQPACQQSCPANAIVFGNLADPESRVSIIKKEVRNYVLLEELNLNSMVSYLAKVRNNKEA
ncbi:MAG: TAT-variant-translocated molybdopterin oxidoreductase [Acidobacteriota bacterium]